MGEHSRDEHDATTRRWQQPKHPKLSEGALRDVMKIGMCASGLFCQTVLGRLTKCVAKALPWKRNRTLATFAWFCSVSRDRWHIRFTGALSGRNFVFVCVTLHCRYIVEPARNFGQHVECLVHPRHHHGDHESDQEDEGKDHGGSPSVEAAAGRAVVGGFRFVVPAAHHRDHLRSTHEVAELDPTPDTDGEHPRCHTCQTTPTRGELPESREEANDECDGDDVCHGEEIRDLHSQAIKVTQRAVAQVYVCALHRIWCKSGVQQQSRVMSFSCMGRCGESRWRKAFTSQP